MTYLCKMLADGAWFLSLTAPAMARTQGVAKGLFLLPIVLWWVWIYQNRKKTRFNWGLWRPIFIGTKDFAAGGRF